MEATHAVAESAIHLGPKYNTQFKGFEVVCTFAVFVHACACVCVCMCACMSVLVSAHIDLSIGQSNKYPA